MYGGQEMQNTKANQKAWRHCWEWNLIGTMVPWFAVQGTIHLNPLLVLFICTQAFPVLFNDLISVFIVQLNTSVSVNEIIYNHVHDFHHTFSPNPSFYCKWAKQQQRTRTQECAIIALGDGWNEGEGGGGREWLDSSEDRPKWKKREKKKPDERGLKIMRKREEQRTRK